MTTDTAVKYFDSTMAGAPALNNTNGTLIAVLDACLVTGFGSVTLSSLVIADNVATGTVSTGHGWAMVGATGPVIAIAGATPAALNGEWRIQSIPSSTQFTFTTSGISNQTATGTITAKRAPAGFSKAFSGTNLAAYRADRLQSNRLFLRIDDTGTSSARIRGYESMSDVNTGTGLFPTDAQLSGGGYVYKANGANRPWRLFSDGRIIYFFSDPGGDNGWSGGIVFGDIDAYRAIDAYSTLLIATTVNNGAVQLYYLENTAASYLARSYTQSGASVLSARYSHRKSTGLGSGGMAYPSVVDNRVHLWPVECWESTALARGLMPGLWNPLHANDLPLNTVVDNIPQLPGRSLLLQRVSGTSNQCLFDLTGPWR